MNLRKAAKKAIDGPKASSADYVAHLRSLGMVIGDNSVIYSPKHCVIDETRPWMIEIGSNVSITEGVTILTHGYDWSVFKGMYGDVLGSAGRVKIGDNVFIGMNSTILKGVTIGSNVVIGANTLINKDVPDNCVVVGNPQRVVSDIDSYLQKRRSVQLDEAADLYDCWRRNSPEGKRGGYPQKTYSPNSSGYSRAKMPLFANPSSSICNIFAAPMIRAVSAWGSLRDRSLVTRSSSPTWTTGHVLSRRT